MKEQNTQKGYGKIKRLCFLGVFFVLSIACIVFSILCLFETDISIINKYTVLFSILAAALICIFCSFAVWATIKEKETFTKTFFSGYVLLLFVLVLIYILLKTGFFTVIRDEKLFEEYLKKAGVWMPLLYGVLQYLQVVILPIPSAVSTAAGVALFGPFRALLYSIVGILLGSFTGFFIGRKLGSKAVAWMVGEDTLNKWQNKVKGKDNLLLTTMFLLPLFPDDVLCFIAGLSSMSWKYFVCMIVISRAITVSGTCYSFQFIPFDTWWGLLIWGIFVLTIVTLFVLVYKNMDKIQEKLERIKESKKNK